MAQRTAQELIVRIQDLTARNVGEYTIGITCADMGTILAYIRKLEHNNEALQRAVQAEKERADNYMGQRLRQIDCYV